MTLPGTLPSPTDFLHGGGEMGARMRALDWGANPLGPPAQWPQSLKTVVRVMLDSRFAMWMAWGEQNIFFCNDAYLPTVGLRRDWVLGERSDRVWEEVWDVIEPRLAHIRATREATWDQGLRLFLRRNGYEEETFHTFSYSPLYDDGQQMAGMLCVVAEETERVLGERRLALLRDLANAHCADAGSIEAAGRVMLQALGPGLHDLPFAALYLGDDSADEAHAAGALLHPGAQVVAQPGGPDGGEGAAQLVAQVMRGGLQIHVPRVQALWGELRGAWPEPVEEALVLPLHGASGQRPGGALVLGISTRRRLDEPYLGFLQLVASQFASQLADTRIRLEAERRAEALAELDRAKNLFFSNVSHEFRTPLTLMLGPADDLLARPDLAPALREPLERMRRNGLRLRKLVNTLLDFSRIEGGQVQGRYALTDLAACTADLASGFRAAIEQAGLRFVVACQPLTHPAYVDRDMWEKVVFNLLSNAFKFSFEGEIEVSLREQDGQAWLSVSDTGVGIDAAALPRVFERFHRVPGARSRTHEGTGIGLALVQELVRLHGGEVEAASEPGRGSCFTVRIPLGKAHLPPASIDEQAEATSPQRHPAFDAALEGEASLLGPVLGRAAVNAPAGLPAPETRGRELVLVVDDNADMRDYIAQLLAPHWSVEQAADGQAALEFIERRMPDLVVTDMMMPRLDGRALLQRVRADPRTRRLPVIVLSAQAGEEARVAGLQQGADDYLVKPFSGAELAARVEVQLMRARVQDLEQRLNKRLADVFHEAPVGVALLSGPEHRYDFVNEIYRRFVHGRDVLGQTVVEALPELEGQGIVELLDNVYATGRPYSGRAVPIRLMDPASGVLHEHHFEFVYQPLPADGPFEAGVAVVALDVTHVDAARRAAESASRAKDEFIAMLGHELRNPLAPILTALQIMKLRDADPASPSANHRAIIERQARHMARLVEDLLDISRISRGSLELRRERMELGRAVDGAVETAMPLLESKRHRLHVEVPVDGLPVYGDESRLRQVIGNLLVNAARYTDAGGHVVVRGWREAETVHLSVSDNGVGMSAEEIASVFDIFVQGGQAYHRPQGGLGLGLTIAQNLTRLHGGTLSARSEGPGHGTEFRLSLPAGAVAQPAAQARLPLPPSHLRVLLVEDNLDAAQVLQDLLRMSGFTVHVAHDGPAALELLHGHAVDVALLDIGLPVMDGHELAHQIQLRDPAHSIRLIAMSGYGQASDIERSRQHGFSNHLVKPVDPDELLRVLG